MEIRNRLFPYPVLCEDTDDYESGEFHVESKVSESLNSLDFVFNITLDVTEILNLVREGLAEYIIHIECPVTSFRKVIKKDVKQIEYSIDKSRINGEISIVAMVVAKTNLDEYSSAFLNEDYTGESISFDRASIMAYENLPKVTIAKDYEELAKDESMFSVVKIVDPDSDEIKPLTFDINGEKIKILVDEKTYDAYIKTKHLKEVVKSMFVLPAVIYMLEEVSGDISSYYPKKWFLKLKTYYSLQGKDFVNEAINGDRNTVEIAQEMLNNPIGKAYCNLFELES